MEKLTCKKCGGELADIGGTFYCWNCNTDYVVENGKLRILTCENCGGDIIDCGDHYECELCGKKYERSDREEEIVPSPEINMLKDVEKYFGFGYRCSPSKSQEKEYYYARKYLSERRFSHSNRYYKQIFSSGPDSWEILFYSVYSEIWEKPDPKYAAKELCNILEMVMKDIIYCVPKEKQRDTYLEVGAECLRTGLFLLEEAEKQKKNSHETATGYISFKDEDLKKAKNDVTEMMLTAVILIHNNFEDPFASGTIAKTAKDICVYKKCGGELFEILEENCSAIEEMIHKTEEQIKKIKAHISEISRMIEESPFEKEAEKLEKQIDSLNKQKESLGIFKAKEKKALQAEIDGLRRKKGEIVGKLLAMEDAANEEIEYYTNAVKELTSKISY